MLKQLRKKSQSTERPPLSREPLYDLNFILALVCQTCFVIANTLMAHYARWIEFLGGDLHQVGWVMGSAAAVSLLARPWLAQWIDRLGARTTWAMGLVIFSVASLTNLLLDGVGPGIYVVRSLTLVGAALVFASSLCYAAQIAPAARRTEAIGILGVGGFVGMLIGPFVGDLFLGNGQREHGQFVSLFITAAAANVLPLLILATLRSPIYVRGPVALSIREFLHTVRRYWPGTILLVDFAFGVAMTCPLIFLASYIDQAGLRWGQASMLGVFFWCYAGLAILLRIGLRRWPEIYGSHIVLTVGMLFMSAAMFSFLLVTPQQPWLLCIPALLGGAGHSLMFHTMTSLTVEKFPVEYRGSGSTLALMMLDMGTFVGAPILGRIGGWYGFGALFCTIGVVCLVSMLVFVMQWRRHSNDG